MASKIKRKTRAAKKSFRKRMRAATTRKVKEPVNSASLLPAHSYP